jgi:hypothetical protein
MSKKSMFLALTTLGNWQELRRGSREWCQPYRDGRATRRPPSVPPEPVFRLLKYLRSVVLGGQIVVTYPSRMEHQRTRVFSAPLWKRGAERL